MLNRNGLGIVFCAVAISLSNAALASTSMQIKTSMGNIELELYDDQAPASVNNFKQYVKSNFYAGTIFHRVIPGFMIQGGGFDSNMNQKPVQAAIKNEAGNGLKNTRGTLAMARTNNPDSATSQFFINVADNAFLNKSPGNAGYAVFGKVTKGMDVIDKIAAAPTASQGMYQDVPRQQIKILGIQNISSKTKK
ncbi:peptidylprolyl isomerase [Acinetobacter sp. WZC-1]|uniref:peptidylprolyl isomerase n=1 Tax=Acinetobacter sp. WZC-1 TaxID=3459034 RepID=UPI00403E2FA0